MTWWRNKKPDLFLIYLKEQIAYWEQKIDTATFPMDVAIEFGLWLLNVILEKYKELQKRD